VLESYLSGKQLPRRLGENYDVIGFDADHCLVKYKLRHLTEVQLELQFDLIIQQFGYPEEVRKLPPNCFHRFAHNWLVWDVEADLLLKLGKDRRVLVAMRAFEKLSDQQVKAVYGEKRVFKTLEWPKSTNFEHNKTYWTFGTFFELNSPILIM